MRPPVTAPELLEVRRETDRLEVRGRVPEELLYLEGHFPGHPVVPGVVQIQWVADLARDHLGCAASPAAIEALKFKSLLLPGADFALSLAAGQGVLRFAFRAGADEVSSGRLRSGAVPQHQSQAPAPPAAGDDLPLRIPQSGRMRLIDRVVSHAAGVTLCHARISDATPLCRDGRAPAWLALELLAQALAAQGGLVVSSGEPARRGFLVAARRIELRTRSFAVGEGLWVRAEHLRGETGFVVAECALGVGGAPSDRATARDRALAWGPLSVFVEG